MYQSEWYGTSLSGTRVRSQMGRALLDDLVVKLLGAAPLADAGQAVGVAAGRQDPEPPL